MRKKLLYFIPLLVLLSIVGVVIFLYNPDSKVIGQTSPTAYDENYSFAQLNAKSRAVNEFGGTANINALVDETFNTFQTVVESGVKTRIANSENLYQTHQRNGVSEVDVVEAVNGLQFKLNTPEFGKTDVNEVRKLRLALRLYAPQFAAHGRQSEQSRTNNVNPTIAPQMSPTEAVFVVLAMINQKQSNPNYQLTLAERSAMWNQNHTTMIGQTLPPNPERSEEMSCAIRDAVNAMTPSELLAIPHRALDILGIEQ